MMAMRNIEFAFEPKLLRNVLILEDGISLEDLVVLFAHILSSIPLEGEAQIVQHHVNIMKTWLLLIK